MSAYIILIWIIIGIITALPFAIIAEEFGGYRILNEEDDLNNLTVFAIGLGMLICAIIWPYYLGVYIYEAYLKK